MGEELWAEAAKTVVYTLNRVTTSKNPLQTRFELFLGSKPNLSNLKIFGQTSIIKIPDNKRDGKLSDRGQKAIFVGYTKRFNTYRFLIDKPNKQITITCDAKFPNNEVEDSDEETENEIKLLSDTDWDNNENIDHNDNASSTSQESNDGTTSSNQEKYSSEDELLQGIQSSSSSSMNEDQAVASNPNQISDQNRRMTRSSSAKQGGSVIGLHQASAPFTLLDEPRTLKDAQNSEDWPKWQEAINKELHALEKNQTWIMVEKPKHIKTIKNKWVFKLKLKPNGEVDRYKARLVAKGYSQIQNVDYSETYAPTASMTSIRLLLAVANQRQTDLIQFDVQTAFLYRDLQEELYMDAPEGFTDNGRVCKLKKSIYGLKQAPRNWNLKFDEFLKRFDLRQSQVDKCVYFNDKRNLLLAIYIGDGMSASTYKELLNDLIKHLKSTFNLKLLNCETFLGSEIRRDKETLSICQKAYIDKLLNRFNIAESKPVHTPEQVGVIFTDSQELEENNRFKELVGSLLYLSTCSRPDITHAVSIASRTSKPTEAHWVALKRILRYLKGTRELCIKYNRNDSNLVGYSDADYANDELTRKSTTGFCIYYGGALITWRCQKQPIITLSTTEAEYVAGCDLVKTLIPIREQLIELNQLDNTKPTTVFIDNQSTIKIVMNENCQSRTKHIDIRHKWLSEQALKKTIEVKHVSGDDQAADLLTKPLHKGKFITNRSKLLTSIIAVLSVITISFSSVQGRDLRMTDVLNTVPSDYVYVRGDTRYKLTNFFVNPCETLFNYSSSLTATETLIKHCFEHYEKKIMNSLSNCNRLPTVGPDLTNIPLSYNCVGNKDSGTGNDRCTIIRNQIKGLKETELERVNLNWNKHKKKIDSLPVLRRGKRASPFLAVIAMSIYATGASYVASKKIEAHSNDIEAIMAQSNNHTAILKESTDFLEKYRDSISAINTWAQEVEDKLGKEDEESRFIKDPLYKGKRAHLVKTYMSWFESQEKLLSEINAAADIKRIPASLITMLNQTNHKQAAKWSTLYDCSYHLENKSMILSLDFALPT